MLIMLVYDRLIESNVELKLVKMFQVVGYRHKRKANFDNMVLSIIIIMNLKVINLKNVQQESYFKIINKYIYFIINIYIYFYRYKYYLFNIKKILENGLIYKKRIKKWKKFW